MRMIVRDGRQSRVCVAAVGPIPDVAVVLDLLIAQFAIHELSSLERCSATQDALLMEAHVFQEFQRGRPSSSQSLLESLRLDGDD